MTSLRNYAVMRTFEQGFELLKHVYDTFGAGGSTNQVLKSFNIMAEKQALGEAPSEFATRLDTLNADLKTSLGDDQLKTILTRGVHDNELKKFMAGEMATNANLTFTQLVQKIDNYVMACKVTHPDDDVEAMLAGTHREVDVDGMYAAPGNVKSHHHEDEPCNTFHTANNAVTSRYNSSSPSARFASQNPQGT
jgi:hypothetical protein